MSLTLSTFSGINISLFLLVFLRMSGAILFNPVLGRDNVPVMLRAALGLLCAIVVTPTLGGMTANITSIPQLVVEGLGELFIGLALGVVVVILFYSVQLAGELIDMQMGLTMAQMYDPRSGVNMPLLGSFFNIIMLIAFFASDAHLALISFVSDSFRLIHPGAFVPTQQSMQFIVALGKDYFEFGFRMALPVLTIEVLCQIAMGMLMRAVPSISVFSIGMHLTALIGLVILAVTATALVTMCSQLVSYTLSEAAQLIKLLSS